MVLLLGPWVKVGTYSYSGEVNSEHIYIPPEQDGVHFHQTGNVGIGR